MKMFLTAVIDIDTSGIHALEDLHKNLQKRSIQVCRLILKLTDLIKSSSKNFQSMLGLVIPLQKIKVSYWRNILKSYTRNLRMEKYGLGAVIKELKLSVH